MTGGKRCHQNSELDLILPLDFLDTFVVALQLMGRFDCLRVGNDGTSVGV